MSRVALCHSCENEPLVMTFAWPGKEFVCFGCGALYTFFGPKAADETTELVEKAEARKAEWGELIAGLIPGTAFHVDCREAGGGCVNEHHRLHATAEELAAHEAAAKRIGERLGIAAP